jgi:hypothetical protein
VRKNVDKQNRFQQQVNNTGRRRRKTIMMRQEFSFAAPREHLRGGRQQL